MYIGQKSELKTHWVAFRAHQAHPWTLPTCLLHGTAALHQPVLASGLDVGQATNMVGWYGGTVCPQHWHHELREWAGGIGEGEGEGEGAFFSFVIHLPLGKSLPWRPGAREASAVMSPIPLSPHTWKQHTSQKVTRVISAPMCVLGEPGGSGRCLTASSAPLGCRSLCCLPAPWPSSGEMKLPAWPPSAAAVPLAAAYPAGPETSLG